MAAGDPPDSFTTVGATTPFASTSATAASIPGVTQTPTHNRRLPSLDVDNSSAAPIRTDADYASDLDDDVDDLVYQSSAPASKPLKSTGKRHQPQPSVTGLLSASSVSSEAHDMGIPPSPVLPSTLERQRRMRDYLEVDLDPETLLGRLQTSARKVRAFVAKNEGFLLIALSQMFFAGINTLVKLLQNRVAIPVWQVIWVRMSVTWAGCYIYMRLAKVEHPLLGPPGVRFLLCVRGTVGFFGLFGIYFSLKYLALSDATSLSFLSPVLVGIFAAILLREPYTFTEAISGVLSLFGVLLIAKPSFLFRGDRSQETTGPGGEVVTPEQRALAVTAALTGVLGAAGAYLTIRKIGKRANALHSIAYFAAYSVIVSTLYPIFIHSPPVFIFDREFLALITPIGIMGFVAQALLTMGLQREKAGRGTLAVYTNLLWALILELIVFKKLPDIFSLLGSVTIIGGAIWVVLEKASPTAKRARSASRASQRSDVVKDEEGTGGRMGMEDLEEGRRWSAEHDGLMEDDMGSENSFEAAVLPGAGGTGER